jgi:hypothetical protein
MPINFTCSLNKRTWSFKILNSVNDHSNPHQTKSVIKQQSMIEDFLSCQRRDRERWRYLDRLEMSGREKLIIFREKYVRLLLVDECHVRRSIVSIFPNPAARHMRLRSARIKSTWAHNRELKAHEPMVNLHPLPSTSWRGEISELASPKFNMPRSERLIYILWRLPHAEERDRNWHHQNSIFIPSKKNQYSKARRRLRLSRLASPRFHI